MTRRLLVLALLFYALPAQAGETWDKLWRNSEQRAEALLQHGDAKAAAAIYADPQRKAYAKLQAGDYAGAADDLAKLHDGEADYNRGNALAHAGDLQGALAAYDAALKSDPNNHDAQHNRELVEKALKQSPPQQQKSGDKKSGNDKQDGQKNGEQKDGDQNKSGQNGKDQNGKDQQSQTGKQNEQSGKEQDSKASGKQDQGKQQGRQSEKSANGASDKQPQSATQANQAGKKDAAKNDAEQARRDAEASLAKPVQQGKQGAGSDDELNGSKPAAMGENDKPKSEKPKSEKEIAQEQWLRSIPDDPGGLLRRKFLIEHLMRQQKAQQ